MKVTGLLLCFCSGVFLAGCAHHHRSDSARQSRLATSHDVKSTARLAATGQVEDGLPGETNIPVYSIADRGPDYRMWQKMESRVNESGQTEWTTNTAYTELATGLHYWEDEQWKESREHIEPLPSAGAAALQGQHKVYFPTDIHAGVIELIT